MHREDPQPAPASGAARDDDKPPVSAIVAEAFLRLDVPSRARMLGRMLAPLGPTALAAAAGGAFAKYVTNARVPLIPVTLQDAARATASQVQDVVRTLQQTHPAVFERLLDVLARDAATIAALSAAIAALTLQRATAARRERR